MIPTRFISVAAAALSSLLSAPGAPAQVPDGWFVTSHAAFTSIPGSGGLWLHHPRVPNTSIRVAGLPAAVTGTTSNSGASRVVLHPDGRLLVGTLAPNGGSVQLHVIQLTGTTYAASLSWSIALGTASSPFNVAGVFEMRLLSATEVLLCVSGIGSGPLAGATLAKVDLSTRTATPISVTGLPTPSWTRVEAAVSGDTAYVALYFPGTAPGASVFCIPLPNGLPRGGNATLLTTWPQGAVTKIEIEASGALLVGWSRTGELWLVDSNNGAILRSTQVAPKLNGFARETTTGGFAFAEGGVNGQRLYWGDGTGTSTLLSGGWGGGITGVDIAPDPAAYGDPSPAFGNGPEWQLAPNPGGRPEVGNLSFAVGIDPPMSGLWLASFAQANLPNWNGLGFDLLVSPTSGATSGTLNAGIVALPLPASVPVNAQLFLQTFHFTYAGPVASEGLRITTL